ncbi:methyl-accepting chemotaxis protein [Dechloromonas sp. A34]|uniref:methyl-accepting chemotaxis protein n=1 Tax=Dechloromonas sp. A34 TaxID=447588 RepID=UPI002B0538A8|nr:methyl-accepting chemotaxis protein [Dechloromonas sp. A34]
MLDFRNYKIGTRLILTTAGALVLVLLVVAIALFSLNQIGDKVERIVNENAVNAELAVDMRMRNLLIGQHVRTALVQEEIEQQLAEKARVDADMANYLAAERRVVESTISPRGKEIVGRILPARQAAEATIKQLFELIKAGNHPETERLFFEDFQPKLQAWFDAVGDYVELQHENSSADLAEISAIESSVRTTLLLLMLVAVAVMIPSGVWVTRQITRPLQDAVKVAEAVAAGNLDNRIDRSGADESAQLMLALEKMQSDLKQRTEAEHKVADETLRIKVALDFTSTNVMVADPDGTIIYCNASILGMMRRAEEDIRTALPGFRADAILDSGFDHCYQTPLHQTSLLGELQRAQRTELSIGGRHFTLVASPIVNQGGDLLGTVVEWRDRTSEVEIESEVSAIIDAAVAGDFNRRLDVAKMSGFFRQISTGINELLDANSHALNDVGEMLARLSQGNLTQKIDANYRGMLGKLRDDANATVDHLKEIVFSIKSATEAISTAAKEIAAGNQDLSGRTEEQASSLEETASSMEQLTGTVKQNADSSRQACDLAGNAQQVAIKGGEVVGQVVQTMSAIHQSSSRIADIIGVIDGIAFQTNILALNAAVEAARAGEQGRGFAVVASEVRNLAQRSAAAAKEIKGLIEDSVNKVEVGNRLVDQAGRTMAEVVSSIRRVATIMTDISDASREQSAGIEQVSRAVTQMDEMTQQNAALVEEAAAAAESLEAQARGLARSVAVFRLPGGVLVDHQENLSGLDIDGAILAHGRWKQRLLDYVAGGGESLDPAVVGRDDQCALGCWIHGDGRQLSGSIRYTELKAEHAGFHRSAAEVIRAYLAGDARAARQRIAGEFSGRSQRVIGLLEAIRPGGKSVLAAKLGVRPAKRLTSGNVPALSAPRDDEWSEF